MVSNHSKLDSGLSHFKIDQVELPRTISHRQRIAINNDQYWRY